MLTSALAEGWAGSSCVCLRDDLTKGFPDWDEDEEAGMHLEDVGENIG